MQNEQAYDLFVCHDGLVVCHPSRGWYGRKQIEANRNLYTQELKDAQDSHAASVTLVKESEKL